MSDDDRPRTPTERARLIVDHDATPRRGNPRSDHPNPVGGFLTLLWPYRRLLVTAGAIAVVGLVLWRIGSALTG